ncbi:MAG: hypothetical protein KC476_11940, partial [Cyanobacteria bacterium HKST-UBA06]|nr:hypothetical protein [Cyanobacteria bacterium HKST-UBA06]
MGRLFGLISQQIDLQDKLGESFNEVSRIADLRLNIQDQKDKLRARLDRGEANQPALMEGILPFNFRARQDIDGDGNNDYFRFDRQLGRFVRVIVRPEEVTRLSNGIEVMSSNHNETLFRLATFDLPITVDGQEINSGRNIFQDASLLGLQNGAFTPRTGTVQGVGDAPLDGGTPGTDQISTPVEQNAFFNNNSSSSSNTGVIGLAAARQGTAFRDNLLQPIMPVASTVSLGQGSGGSPTEHLINLLYNHYAASGTAQVHGPAPIVGNQSRVELSPIHLQALARLLTGTPSGNPVGVFASGTSVLGGQFVVTSATAAQPIDLNAHVANNPRVTAMANVANFTGGAAQQTAFIQALATAY